MILTNQKDCKIFYIPPKNQRKRGDECGKKQRVPN